ncbi:ribonuclease PH [Mycoplasmatota bacterium]|nr:ribonuclease PH [Mycoplasmatota bacterium]
MRNNNRQSDEKRAVTFDLNVNMHAEGSVLVSLGNTKVICTATIDEKIPPFLRGENKGWVTAEYSMLPRATNVRNVRESARGKLTGRTMEIQRLVGRTLRSIVDLHKLGERSITIDCDVIQADGGTRTASITGGFIAMKMAINKLLEAKVITEDPIKEYLAALSVGICEGEVRLDLEYEEDSKAEVDMNIVMTESGQFVEIQGTGEEHTFSEEQLMEMIKLAKKGIKELIKSQKEALGE